MAPPMFVKPSNLEISKCAGGCEHEANLGASWTLWGSSSKQPEVSPAQPSPCPCGRSAWFLSAQSIAAASSSPGPSAASSASRPSAAGPWAWRSAVSLSSRHPPRAARSWIELPKSQRRDRQKGQKKMVNGGFARFASLILEEEPSK